MPSQFFNNRVIVTGHDAHGNAIFKSIAPPQDAIAASENFDAAAAAQEMRRLSPGIAECFEPENPGMYTTDTLDYGIILSGRFGWSSTAAGLSIFIPATWSYRTQRAMPGAIAAATPPRWHSSCLAAQGNATDRCSR